jgi:hypothetical protein
LKGVTAKLYDPAHYEVPFTAYLDLRVSYKWNDDIQFEWGLRPKKVLE